jgi:hypothetical protein
MSLQSTIYCLDANVLIKAWESYYSPDLCPTYWDVLDDLGAKGQLFVPSWVAEEIHRTDDDLSKWLMKSRIKVRQVSEEVTLKVREVFAKDKRHELLVDNTKQRSLADPWLIAHAMVENACVVSKESKSTAAHNKKVKIPDVCEAMGVRCIDDFRMIEELGIKFACAL